MSSVIALEDQLSHAMMQGIMDSFKKELRDQLQKEASVIIERTITLLSERVKAKIESDDDFLKDKKHISLSWCIKREEQ